MNSSPPQIPVQPAALQFGLPNFAARLQDKSKGAVKIVALGSSTMEGEGRIVAFPYRLEAALRDEYWRRHDYKEKRMIDVINRGIGGEEAPKEFGRMQNDVLAGQPQLVIWQIGTNSVWQSAKDNPPSRDETIAKLGQGVRLLLDAKTIDVVLMDLQYVPAVLTPATHAQAEAMVSAIANVASEKKVNLFRRFAFMKALHEIEGISFDRLVDPADTDRLHDSDWTTQRLASGLSQIIFDAVGKIS